MSLRHHIDGVDQEIFVPAANFQLPDSVGMS